MRTERPKNVAGVQRCRQQRIHIDHRTARGSDGDDRHVHQYLIGKQAFDRCLGFGVAGGADRQIWRDQSQPFVIATPLDHPFARLQAGEAVTAADGQGDEVPFAGKILGQLGQDLSVLLSLPKVEQTLRVLLIDDHEFLEALGHFVERRQFSARSARQSHASSHDRSK